MSLQPAGRGDKEGNRFEYNWTILKLLEVIQEKIEYVVVEAVGEDEEGVDLWIGNKDGTREGQQCKASNGNDECWKYGSINAKGIVDKWKVQLERDPRNLVSLVSPLAFGQLEGLVRRAKTTNGNPCDFLEYQIDGSSRENRDLFDKLCKKWALDYRQNEDDLKRAINWLSRINYRQEPNSELKNNILMKIEMLFLGDAEQIYANFLVFLLTKDIWGMQIDLVMLEKFFKDKKIEYRNLDKDERILPNLKRLNEEYERGYFPFKNGLIERRVVSNCKTAINTGKSIIMFGDAGMGKSGCTANIIDLCKCKDIVYLAIKLDKRVPFGTPEIWSNHMGLPASLTNCLHSIAKRKKAVLILDQLDALRWTQVHSGEALDVCFRIIDEVEKINKEREEKISIVMACRTYDFENDQNIRRLFENDKNGQDIMEWVEIPVRDLELDEVKEILGENYDKLSQKLKELVRTPSNLYILQQLDIGENELIISTTRQLISRWWAQLNEKAKRAGLSEGELNDFKDKLVRYCEKNGRLFAPKVVFQGVSTCIAFLASNGFILVQEEKIFFVHQSILDCFLCENMVQRYYDGEEINFIIGDMKKQIPARRYQVQMFMQYLLEMSSEDFLDAGRKLLKAQGIRFNIKYVFLEVLRTVEGLDRDIERFVLEMLEEPEWGKHILNTVIKGRICYVEVLQKAGVLDRRMKEKDRRAEAIDIMILIAPRYSAAHIEFIRRYIFQDGEEAEKWNKCFDFPFDQDSDELFELRMEFYERYPNMSGSNYIDLKEMMDRAEARTIRMLEFWLRYKEKNSYSYEQNLEDEDGDIRVKDYSKVIETFIPFLPNDGVYIRYGDWSARFQYHFTLERICMKLLKAANQVLVEMAPDIFWQIYEPYMASRNELYNELILDALVYFSDEKYADQIIQYLCIDFDKTLFERTSNSGNSLDLAKKVIEKFSDKCSDEMYEILEDKIIHYWDAYSKQHYKDRIEWNRSNKGNNVTYRPFYGDFQYEIIQVLPEKRRSCNVKALLKTLGNTFEKRESKYTYDQPSGGFVVSSVTGKKLTISNWAGILINKKIKKRQVMNWKMIDGNVIENTLETFSSSFGDAVSTRPEEMIKLVLSIEESINETYIEALFRGIAYSAELNNVETSLIEKLFVKFPCNQESKRAEYMCEIFQRKDNSNWSKYSLDILKDIAISNNGVLEHSSVREEDSDKQTARDLESKSINCARGCAAYAIGKLLRDDKEKFCMFEEAIECLCKAQDSSVQYAALAALWPVYDIKKEWAASRILKLFREDIRLIAVQDGREMMYNLYSLHREEILSLVEKCYCSEDKRLIEIGSYLIVDLYILKNEFQGEIFCISQLNKEQIEFTVKMLIAYMGNDEYISKAKAVLEKYIDASLEVVNTWSRLFYDNRVNLKRDKEFLLKLMKSSIGERVLSVFVHYLEKNNVSLMEYAEIILQMGENLLTVERKDNSGLWSVSRHISNLIIKLYDQASGDSKGNEDIIERCLDVWDLMYKNEIGEARRITSKIMGL